MLNEWVTFLRHHHELYYVFEIAGLVVAAWVLRKLVFYRLRLWAERTTTTVDDQLVDLLDRAVKPLLSLGVLAISLNMIPLSGKFLSPANRILKVLVLAVFPLALARNGLRIFVIGELCVRISPDMINSAIHRQGGPLFFALSLIPLGVLLYALAKSDRPARAVNPRQQ